jgi:hypothetical protein
MKRLKTYWLILGVVLFTLTSCSRAQKPKMVNEPSTEHGELLKHKKVLIVYLSRTKNTQAVAEMIHKKVGGATWWHWNW